MTPDKELVSIIDSDNAGQLQLLLEAGLPPDAKIRVLSEASEPLLLLEYATMRDAREVTALLLRAGAKPDQGKFKPLIRAVLAHRIEIAKILLDGGANPNIKVREPAKSDTGLTPLMFAVSTLRGPELVEMLLARGADPHVVTKKGNTALSRSMAYGDAHATKRLLQAGCKADGSLLLRPIYKGDLDMVRTFIAAGADVNVTGIWSQKKGRFWVDAPVDCTLLNAAVNERSDRVELLRNLLPGERAKHEARHQTLADLYLTMVKELIQAGADVNRISVSVTPLYWAAEGGDLETVKLLLEAGADPNLAEGLPRSMPLHRACRGGFVEIVELLLKAGADVKMADEEGRTALEELRQLKKTNQIEIWELASKQGTKLEPGMVETLYEEWNKNKARLIELLEKIPGSERKPETGGESPMSA